MSLYPIQDAFVRGEISPRLHSRASLDLYRAALSECRNFLTLPHGGIRKRAGTYLAAETKTTGKTRVIPFEFSQTQAYALELGEGYCRVYAYGAFVVEFATPWTADQLAALQYAQSADVMWVVHPQVAPRKITRRGQTNWTVEEVSFYDGPFGTSNLDEAKKVYASGETGTVTVTANFDLFTSNDIGKLFRIDMESYGEINPWSPGEVMAPKGTQVNGILARYDGNVYRSASTGSSSGDGGWRYGSTPPTHLKGIERDGPQVSVQDSYISGVAWEYLHSGYGVGRITGVTNAQTATVELISRMPAQVVGSANAQYQWSFGAFGPDARPVAVTLFEERLFFASKLSVYGSKTGDFTSFRLGEKDDDALQFLLAANEANDILWLADTDGYLAIGTTGGVRALAGSGVDEALTPSSFKNRSSATLNCSNIRPVETGRSYLYVAAGRQIVAEMAVNNGGRFEGQDASQISEHIAKQAGGIIDIAFQSNPDPMMWACLVNGELMGFTYQPDQDVRGFHRHLGTDAKVQSVCVTPAQMGADDVWVVVKRTVNGQEKQFLEILQPAFEYGVKADVFAVDCGRTYQGAPTNTVSGLSYLEGAQVSALADGVRYDDLTVTSGTLTLPNGKTAGTIHVGLPYEGTAASLELDVGGRDGSIIGRRKKVSKLILSLLETDLSGLEVQSLMKKRWEPAKLPSVAIPDGSIDLFTGNISIPIEDSWEGMGQIRIRHQGAGPCTIRSIVPVFDSEAT